MRFSGLLIPPYHSPKNIPLYLGVKLQCRMHVQLLPGILLFIWVLVKIVVRSIKKWLVYRKNPPYHSPYHF